MKPSAEEMLPYWEHRAKVAEEMLSKAEQHLAQARALLASIGEPIFLPNEHNGYECVWCNQRSRFATEIPHKANCDWSRIRAFLAQKE